MDEKLTKPVFLSINFLSLFLSISISFSTALQYQTFVLNSLPKTHTFSRAAQHEPEITPEPDNILSLELIHTDHLRSASNITREALFKRRLKRDLQRVKALSAHAAAVTRSHTAVKHRRPGSANSSVFSGVLQGSGEYFTRLGIGTPPKYVDMILDTGSDVVWLQCAPCEKCYPQSDPVFDPSKSKSFSSVACGSKRCQLLDSPNCDTRNHRCLYQVSYGDDSFTSGEFSVETLTFRRNRVKNIAFGCGHDNKGFDGAAGLLGLGRGILSFPNQSRQRFGGKFSYCLVDRLSSKKSSILFGDSAVSRKAVFTPMLNNPKMDTFYYVGLNGISVGGARVRGIPKSVFKLQHGGSGGVIIDSGTTVTRLAEPAYKALRNAFRNGSSHLKPFSNFSLFDTCFNLSGRAKVKVPTVVLHFDRANVSLPADNYITLVDTDGKFCFSFAGTTGGLSIIGNIQQQGFRVSFDLVDNRVGFAPNSCG